MTARVMPGASSTSTNRAALSRIRGIGEQRVVGSHVAAQHDPLQAREQRQNAVARNTLGRNAGAATAGDGYRHGQCRDCQTHASIRTRFTARSGFSGIALRSRGFSRQTAS